MTDIKHDLNVLVLVAKTDAALTEHRAELSRIPGKLSRAERELAQIEAAEKKSIAAFEAKRKERRTLEGTLQDNEAKVTNLRNQLMSADSNKQYQTFLREIDVLEQDIDAKEERLLELMDELDDHRTDHETELKKLAEESADKRGDIDALKERASYLEREIDKLEKDKPGYLKDIDPALKKTYDRISQNLGILAVTRVDDDNCGGCGAKLPPQAVVEIRKNDRFITCQTCGRILIHYVD
jgi:predicted  nucleic acid-binding Zn-ribbon protein